MKRFVFTIILLAGCFALAYENTTLNISAAGSRLSGDTYTSVGSLVPVGGQSSESGTLFHQSGFAAGFILQPNTAFGTLPDELNPDNDSDGLDDGEEIVEGSNLWKSDSDGDGLGDFDEVRTHGTSPILADSDADGMNDARELIAGTSPTNQSSVLSVSSAVLSDGRRQLSWFGVSGRFYTFQYCDSLMEGNWISSQFEQEGGDTVLSLTDSEIRSNRFYRVLVRQP